MKTLPVELLNKIGKRYSFLTYGLAIDYVGEMRYYVALDKQVNYLDRWWESRRFKFDDAVFSLKSEIDYISIRLDNADLSLNALFRDRDVRNRIATIYVFGVDEPLKIVAHTILFSGVIDSVEIGERDVVLRVANPFIMWKTRTPRRVHQATCPWDFKGAECGYNGSETECDQTWDRCKQLGNHINFGGFRWLPSLVNKEIWWGRVPKK